MSIEAKPAPSCETTASLLGRWSWFLGTSTIQCSDDIFDIHSLARPRCKTADVALFYHAVHKADVEHLHFIAERVADVGGPFLTEHRLLQADGTTRWVRSLGCCYLDGARPTHIEGVLFDVTGQHSSPELQPLTETPDLRLLRHAVAIRRTAEELDDAGVRSFASTLLGWFERHQGRFMPLRRRPH